MKKSSLNSISNVGPKEYKSIDNDVWSHVYDELVPVNIGNLRLTTKVDGYDYISSRYDSAHVLPCDDDIIVYASSEEELTLAKLVAEAYGLETDVVWRSPSFIRENPDKAFNCVIYID